MVINSYKDLDVWERGMELVDLVYNVTSNFPKDEMYGLTSQLRRCAVSVPSNIAEGSARNGTRDLIKFLSIAKGSLAEIETQLIISGKRQYIEKNIVDDLHGKTEVIDRMLYNLINSLRKRL